MLPYIYISGFSVPMFYVCLICGLVFHIAVTTLRHGEYDISAARAFIFAFTAMFTGVLCTKLWKLVWAWKLFREVGFWALGQDTFGAVIFLPLFTPLFSKVFKISGIKIRNMMAIGLCAITIFMRFGCLCNGCCRGIDIWAGEVHINLIYAAPILESIGSAAILVLLFSFDGKEEKELYPIFLALYGSMRLIFGFLFDLTDDIYFGLYWTQLEGLATAVLGLTLLGISQKKKKIYKLGCKDYEERTISAK